MNYLLVYQDESRAIVEEINLTEEQTQTTRVFAFPDDLTPDSELLMEYEWCSYTGIVHLPNEPPPPPPQALGSQKIFLENLALDLNITPEDFLLAHRIGYCHDIQKRKNLWEMYKNNLSLEKQTTFISCAVIAGMSLI